MTLTKYDKAKLPEQQIRNDGALSRTFLLPQYGIITRGRKGKLSQEELRMPADQATEACSARFEAKWAAEVQRARTQGKQPSLLKALVASFGWEVFWAGVWKTMWSIFVILGAYYFVRSLVQYVTPVSRGPNIYNVEPVPGTGWILSAAFFVDSIFVGIALQRMGDACVRAGIKIRSALMTAVYRKTFALSSVHNEGAGNVVSLVSTDCSKLYEGVLAFHNVWTAPLETLALIALLLGNIKQYGLPALGIVVIVLPLQYYFGLLIARCKTETVEVSDSRVLRMQEILLAIKLVKFYNWQDSFAKQVSDVRDKEISLMNRAAVVKTLNLCLVFAVPPVIALVIYATYVWNVQPLDATLSFTILSLFNTLRFPLVVLPKALRGTSEAIASINRLQQFLLIEESPDAEKSQVVEARFENVVLSHHNSGKDDFKLHIPRFEVKPGEVAAIIGRVGSGKSSVFTAVLDNMKVESGLVSVGGRIAYVPQSPWVQNLTLRDNILFGLPYDEERYKAVIHACALELDLQILPNGDQSMAGERGINLSGGQRQRVCLARAAYHPADIVLLDNPLSAVDQHTALHIFNYCIKGLLKDKAVIWITHQLELLPNCTNIAIMEDGHVSYFGGYDADILNKRLPVDHLLFATVEAGESGVKVESRSSPGKSAADEASAKAAAAGVAKAASTSPFSNAAQDATSGTVTAGAEAGANGSHKEGEAEGSSPVGTSAGGKPLLNPKASRQSFQRSTDPSVRPVDSVSNLLSHLDEEEKKERELAAKEQLQPVGSGVLADVSNRLKRLSGRKSGEEDTPNPPESALDETPEQIAAKFNGMATRLTATKALRVYVAAGGTVMAIFSVYIFAAAQTCRIYSDLWIRWMAADTWQLYPNYAGLATFQGSVYGTITEANLSYILGYLSFIVCFICLLLCRDWFFSVWHIRGSTRLHNRLFQRVLKAPILFFLRTPVGDVLNSFAKDQDTLDETLPDTLHMSLIYLMILLTSLAIVTVSIYYYAALTAALLGAFLIMQQFYLPAATVLKRWAGETASQVYVHVDESLHGMDVIKAFDAVNYFIQENVARINQHHLALFNTEQCHLWLAFWCDFFGAIMVVATCLLSVGLKDTLSSAAVGLAISNTIQVLVFFTWVVRGAADTVSMWDAVERIATFSTNVPEEIEVADDDATQDIASLTAPSVPPGGGGGGGLGTTSTEMVALDSGAGFFKKGKGKGKGRSPPSQVVVQMGPEVGKGEFVETQSGGSALIPAGMAEWPLRGDIRFQKLCLRYYPGAPLALKFVTFHIRDKEKIGVVGRTGSGKTTLLMALFRMFEPASGRILIDGYNISALPLSMVRSRLAIIPQEPVMFKGTVRSNLDPFGEVPDEELWHALDMVHLKQAISEMPGGLDAAVAEGGSNFSLGQKQLVCMGRCVLKKTRILVLDEATAAMDLQTDALIQKTIRRVFKERTTITIAHRLDTIIFSDRILAMAQGQLKEFDEPDRLLRRKESMFNKLVDDTGPHASAMLRRMAAEGPRDDNDEEGDEAARAA